jgi:hypothetical protein
VEIIAPPFFKKSKMNKIDFKKIRDKLPNHYTEDIIELVHNNDDRGFKYTIDAGDVKRALNGKCGNTLVFNAIMKAAQELIDIKEETDVLLQKLSA